MNVEMRYLSKLGHTKDIANAMAEELNNRPLIKSLIGIIVML